MAYRRDYKKGPKRNGGYSFNSIGRSAGTWFAVGLYGGRGPGPLTIRARQNSATSKRKHLITLAPVSILNKPEPDDGKA